LWRIHTENLSRITGEQHWFTCNLFLYVSVKNRALNLKTF